MTVLIASLAAVNIAAITYALKRIGDLETLVNSMATMVGEMWDDLARDDADSENGGSLVPGNGGGTGVKPFPRHGGNGPKPYPKYGGSKSFYPGGGHGGSEPAHSPGPYGGGDGGGNDDA